MLTPFESRKKKIKIESLDKNLLHNLKKTCAINIHEPTMM